jgi:hypothetical protein
VKVRLHFCTADADCHHCCFTTGHCTETQQASLNMPICRQLQCRHMYAAPACRSLHPVESLINWQTSTKPNHQPVGHPAAFTAAAGPVRTVEPRRSMRHTHTHTLSHTHTANATHFLGQNTNNPRVQQNFDHTHKNTSLHIALCNRHFSMKALAAHLSAQHHTAMTYPTCSTTNTSQLKGRPPLQDNMI